MLAIKFSRKGKKNQPFFRIIVLEKSKDPWGDFLEDVGFYNPLTKKASLNKKRIKHWLSCGAQPTGSVHNLLVSRGIIKAEKVKVTKVHKKKAKVEAKPKQKVKKQETAEKEVVKEEAKPVEQEKKQVEQTKEFGEKQKTDKKDIKS